LFALFEFPSGRQLPLEFLFFPCCGCGKRIGGAKKERRYRCHECSSLDLCYECMSAANYGRGKTTHWPSHQYTTFEEPGSVAIDVDETQCNECGTRTSGTRYRCSICPNYHLCNRCNAQDKHKNHSKRAFVDPWNIPLRTFLEIGNPFAKRLSSQAEFRRVKKLFFDSWKKFSTKGLTVVGIYSIKNPVLRDNYEKYKAALAKLAIPDHVEELWHGTKMLCSLTSGNLCYNRGCSLCAISVLGFDHNRARSDAGTFCRFGKGIYFAPNSCKSHAYTSPASCHSVILCQVALGTQFLTFQRMTTLTTPPLGYNSVSGVVGGELNWPEKVVYASSACLPTHAVLYTLKNTVQDKDESVL